VALRAGTNTTGRLNGIAGAVVVITALVTVAFSMGGAVAAPVNPSQGRGSSLAVATRLTKPNATGTATHPQAGVANRGVKLESWTVKLEDRAVKLEGWTVKLESWTVKLEVRAVKLEKRPTYQAAKGRKGPDLRKTSSGSRTVVVPRTTVTTQVGLQTTTTSVPLTNAMPMPLPSASPVTTGVTTTTAAPTTSTTVPVVSTTVPAVSTAVPVGSTTVPVGSTTVPVVSTTVPVVSTTSSVPTTAPSGSSAPPQRLTAATSPGLGLLGVDGDNFAAEAGAGIGFVTINVGWANAEPSNGVFDTDYIGAVQAEIASARSLGLHVILDPGLQYAPDWVFQLPGGARFVDQYGDAFGGAEVSGNDVANGVTDMAVRSAEGNYLQWLGSQVPGSELSAVRVGGGPLGELRYPEGSYNGHSDCFWAYDPSTQATSPVPGWVPGTGNAAQATLFLDAYNKNLVNFGDWLDQSMATDFGTNELVLLGGWGERPGVAEQETASLLTLGYDEFSQGLDWATLLPSLPDRAGSIAYTTYLDAPSYGTTPQTVDPADYIATLAEPLGMRVGGENTGNGTIADLDLVVQRGLQLHMAIVNWMDEAQVIASDSGSSPGQPSMSDLVHAAQQLIG
jgi:hypothetical protein